MTERASPAADATGAALRAPAQSRIRVLLGAFVRIEDLLLAAVIAFAPALLGTGRSSSPIGGEGVGEAILELAAVLGALACAVARRPDTPGQPAAGSAVPTAALGPLTGGLLIVALSGGTALDVPSWAVTAYAVLALTVMLAARFLIPPIPVAIRRLLMTPFVLVAGNLFWAVLGAVFAHPLIQGRVDLAGLRSMLAGPEFGFLVAFSAVYYAMLVYAPRQVAEHEGGPIAWAIRYGIFLASVVFGLGWLGAIGG